MSGLGGGDNPFGTKGGGISRKGKGSSLRSQRKGGGISRKGKGSSLRSQRKGGGISRKGKGSSLRSQRKSVLSEPPPVEPQVNSPPVEPQVNSHQSPGEQKVDPDGRNPHERIQELEDWLDRLQEKVNDSVTFEGRISSLEEAIGLVDPFNPPRGRSTLLIEAGSGIRIEKYPGRIRISRDGEQSISLLPDHPFRTTKDSGLVVDVSEGKVFGGTSANAPFTVTAGSHTLVNGTNHIYLRVEIGADLLTVANITTSSGSADEYTHYIISVTRLAGTTLPVNTWNHQSITTGYRYVPIAEVTATGGEVTAIDQKLKGDYTEVADGQTFLVETGS